ncbi:excinuclease Cho [Luteimonas sp. M1R5S18]|uniref:Excinuclease cho n=1 Tax=Luteimonas rhizosphaericola TaxID=3042024 RepID=A0ABT6JKT9_9GAMM|nr:excinuclease Cho [Luteimonas rhizosphaericola]MDH5830631.1 excinuclease Cho [Luteimonas rhizosphaericola]
MYVPLPARRTEAAHYVYPEHLRPQIAGLPRASGVYVFHGEGAGPPLYIGKSVDIRHRVLDHLRTPEEARLLRQTRRIEFTRTAGDLGAQLLEAQQIKLRQPVHNKKLRRRRQLCSIRLLCGRPEVVHSHELPFASTARLYGLFSSRVAALQALRAIADEHRLCYGLVGIERLPAGRACFRAGIGRCAGACCGAEPRADHEARLEAALEALALAVWPYAGAVGIVEEGVDLTEIHVVDGWQYLGSAATRARARRLVARVSGFDNDGYRILAGPLMAGRYRVVLL